ncbi:MAG: CHAT domain-containing protein, partial [Phormidesmis sp.]
MSAPTAASRTILFLAANPKNTRSLRLDQELRDIGEGLQRAQKRDRFTLEQRLAVRPRDIQRAMLDVRPQIVHFSGHGEGEEGLVFEDVSGNAQRVSGDALGSLFSLFSDQIQCVLLNGCYSEVQAKAIVQHVPYVIGMRRAIEDRSAITFSIGFYDALGAGRDIEFAYRLGCNAIQMESTGSAGVSRDISLVDMPENVSAPTKQHLMPILLQQSEIERYRGEAKKLKNSPFITGTPIVHPRYFFGRQRVLKRLFNLLKTHPLQNAAIIGMRRSGKTSLLNYLRTITTTPSDQLRPGQRSDW